MRREPRSCTGAFAGMAMRSAILKGVTYLLRSVALRISANTGVRILALRRRSVGTQHFTLTGDLRKASELLLGLYRVPGPYLSGNWALRARCGGRARRYAKRP